jgi:hypothetical protein
VIAGGSYVSTWDGAQFQLTFAPNLSLYATVASLASYVTNSSLASTLAAYLTIANAVATYAPIASPTLTGNVGVPTRATSDNTANAASTAFVQAVNNQQIIKTGIFGPVVGDSSGGPIVFATQFPTTCLGVQFTCLNGFVRTYLTSYNAQQFFWASTLGDIPCSIFYTAVGS